MSEHIDRFTLDAYVEQTLPAAERRTVEAHVTTCPACQAGLASAKQMTALLYDLPREAPAPNLAARINAAIAAQRAQRAPAVTWRMPSLVPAALVLGLVLLVLTVPQWSGWAQAVEAQLPTEQTILSGLGTLVADPGTALDALMLWMEQVLITLAIVVLALVSFVGLAQLLGRDRPQAVTPGASV
jgi:anti-sigma factor RsiW